MSLKHYHVSEVGRCIDRQEVKKQAWDGAICLGQQSPKPPHPGTNQKSPHGVTIHFGVVPIHFFPCKVSDDRCRASEHGGAKEIEIKKWKKIWSSHFGDSKAHHRQNVQ